MLCWFCRSSKSCTRNAHVHVTAATDVHQYTGIMHSYSVTTFVSVNCRVHCVRLNVYTHRTRLLNSLFSFHIFFCLPLSLSGPTGGDVGSCSSLPTQCSEGLKRGSHAMPPSDTSQILLCEGIVVCKHLYCSIYSILHTHAITLYKGSTLRTRH